MRETEMTSFTKFDASEFLDNEEVIAHYLAATLEEGDPDLFISALVDVEKARAVNHAAAAAQAGPSNS